MIKLVKVSKRFNKKLFSNFSYIFNKGKIYSIIGPSGCGKSTLLSMIANKIKRYSGSIYYKDIDIKTLKNYTFESIGYVYQDYQLFDNLTGLENITLYFKLKGIDYNPYIYKINTLSKYFNVYDVINQKVKYMSGGEKQRIAIIKALIKKPDIILLDEPSSALDKLNSKLLIDYLHEIKKDKIIIIVTHDMYLSNKCDEVIDFLNLQSINTTVKPIIKKERKIKFNYLSKLYQKVLASKKIYSYISTAILSFGLISISLSFVIKDFINEIVSSSFSIFNTSDYVTIKAKDNKNIIDFNNEKFDDINYVYYEGIASDQKEQIKENSMIDNVYFNDLLLNETLFVFDNYLSSHEENFVLYVPKKDNIYSQNINYLTIDFNDKNINILIDKIYQSNDENYYIYCNNISYLYRYFNEFNINYGLYKYYYSYNSKLLYEKLINDNKYKDYLFYHYYENNVIQIIENNYSRLTKDIINIDYLHCDFTHTYIDYDTGLIYLLTIPNTLVIIDNNLKSYQVGVSKKCNIKQKYITIFDKEYEIAYQSNETNYEIIYMSEFTFDLLNDDIFYVGIVKKEDINLLDLNNIMVNENLFDSKKITSFDYISKFLLFFSIIVIILAFLSTVTIFNINFISKKKDVKLLSNMGIYDESLVKLLLKEPISNIIYCSFYGAFFMVFSGFLVRVIYKSLTNVILNINVSITLLIALIILPLILLVPILIVKTKVFLSNNIKK